MSDLVRCSRSRSRTIAVAAFAGCLLALTTAAASAPTAVAKPSKRVASKGESAALEKTVLTTLGGRTLYSLSAERNGRFICTHACLTDWHPLTVPAGTRPTGPVRLGTIVRPDGRTQVTYKGLPLYRFAGDQKAGEANGEGFKDVGTWHAATPPAPKGQPTPQPPPAENPYPY